MTELDLFHQYIPDIAEMIINQRERTQEQRVQWYKDCASISSKKAATFMVCAGSIVIRTMLS